MATYQKPGLKRDIRLYIYEQLAALLEKSGAPTLGDVLSSNELRQKYQHELAKIEGQLLNLDELTSSRGRQAITPLRKQLASLDRAQIQREIAALKKKEMAALKKKAGYQ
jgi:hypothetical protein